MLSHIKRLAARFTYGVPRSELRFAEQMAGLDFFKACDGVLDIGANQGMFSTAVALANRQIAIHAFEPLPMLQEKLRHRTRTFGNVTVHKCALGSAPGTADLHFGSFHEASSLLPMDQRHEAYFPGSSPTETVKVEVKTLDQFFSEHPELHRVFMKLDVQGFELEVLSGAARSLDKIGAALVEISFEELYQGGATGEKLITTLFAHEFKLAGFFRPLYRPGSSLPVSGDCLFLRR